MESLLTVLDLARVLKKTPRAVRLLRHRGVLPEVVKVGSSIYFRESDIRQMLKLDKRELENENKEG